MEMDERTFQRFIARFQSLELRYSRSEVIETPPGGGRDTLTANRVYYIATAAGGGSDSNTGLTALTPFLTRQKAWDTIASLDLSIYTVQVNIADGTYTDALLIDKTPVGFGLVSFIGNTATPANVVISTVATCNNATVPCNVFFNGMRLAASAGNCIGTSNPDSVISMGTNIQYNTASGAHLRCDGGKISQAATYSIIGGAAYHLLAQLNGVIALGGGTVTLTGTPNFTGAFIRCATGGAVSWFVPTFSGAATGLQYDVSSGGLIYTFTNVVLPGNFLGLNLGGYVDQPYYTARNLAQFDKANTTLANVTGLTLTVEAGRTYKFIARLYTTSNVASGVKAAIAGTATATAIIYEAVVTQAGAMVVPGTTRAAAMATTVGNVTAVTTATITIEGQITVNAAGTLTVQFADNAGVNTSSVLVGSSFVMEDVTYSAA